MQDDNARMKQYRSFSLKQKSEEFIDRFRSNPSIIRHLLTMSPNAVLLIVRSYFYQQFRNQ